MSQTVQALRELLRSPEPGTVALAAITIVRYELAKMKERYHASSVRLARQRKENNPFRNELPPLPSRGVTVEKTRCDTRCDSPPPATQSPKSQPVAASPIAATKPRCDTLPAPPVPTALLQPTNPVAKKGKTAVVDAIRRKRWHLARPAKADAMDQHAALGMPGNNQRRVPQIEGLMTSFLGH